MELVFCQKLLPLLCGGAGCQRTSRKAGIFLHMPPEWWVVHWIQSLFQGLIHLYRSKQTCASNFIDVDPSWPMLSLPQGKGTIAALLQRDPMDGAVEPSNWLLIGIINKPFARRCRNYVRTRIWVVQKLPTLNSQNRYGDNRAVNITKGGGFGSGLQYLGWVYATHSVFPIQNCFFSPCPLGAGGGRNKLPSSLLLFAKVQRKMRCIYLKIYIPLFHLMMRHSTVVSIS